MSDLAVPFPEDLAANFVLFTLDMKMIFLVLLAILYAFRSFKIEFVAPFEHFAASFSNYASPKYGKGECAGMSPGLFCFVTFFLKRSSRIGPITVAINTDLNGLLL